MEDATTEEVSRPAKRSKIEPRNFENDSRSSYRQRSPVPRRRGERPLRGRPDRDNRRHGDSYRPVYREERSRQRSASPIRELPVERALHPRTKKSTRDRKENRSSRIHSLRNLLSRGTLPATVHQEKERELAALLFEQQKEGLQKAGKKNLKRYHFIRFVERQKATRTVKKLKKQQEGGDVSEELRQQLHEAEVDVNYTIYCPLAQKYIAIYAREDNTDANQSFLARNMSAMNRKDYAILDDDQKRGIETACMEAANAFHLADSTGETKPPMWYVVEAKMKEGQKALETLRDEPLNTDGMQSDLVIGRNSKRRPDWLNDDGTIDPQDLDSDSDDENGGAAITAERDDDEMSDGDGGFFQKR